MDKEFWISLYYFNSSVLYYHFHICFLTAIFNNIKDEHIPSLQALKRHNSEVHTEDKPYKCETCGKTFRCKKYLRDHMSIHRGEKPCLCEGFDNEQDLNNHLVTKHSDIDGRSHKCETCPARFKSLSELKQHIKIHTGKKPHVCEICGKAFTIKSNLSKHSNIHTGKKPHECSICNKRFTQKIGLKRHMKTKVHMSDIVVKN
ncbi:PREDICTED: zinc finger protein 525-like [Trachymyrmex cornetzi]|uniref:zinc finger protein 525-like n=1 Tax=Trachymyrmex cornetzi TaxID=471704 RepID=UPI00084ED70B|nr:PREDICTED: zinc finger protein 525-like [Trachymyrmex cornetzi]